MLYCCPRNQSNKVKEIVGRVQNWVHIAFVAWGKVFGPAMENLSQIFAHGKNS